MKEIKSYSATFNSSSFFVSAALAPSLLGYPPASGQSPISLLLNPGLLPACCDHHGEGENKVPCSLEEGHIKHCNARPEQLEMDFETCS